MASNFHEELSLLYQNSQSVFENTRHVKYSTKETVLRNSQFIRQLLPNDPSRQTIVDDVVRQAVFKFTEDASQSDTLTPWMKESRNLRRVIKGLNISISGDQPLFQSRYFSLLLDAIEYLGNHILIKPLSRFVFRYWRDVFFSLNPKIVDRLSFIIDRFSQYPTKSGGRQFSILKQYRDYLTSKDGPGKIALELVESNSTPQLYAIEKKWPSYMVSSQWMDVLCIEYYRSFKQYTASHVAILQKMPELESVVARKIILAIMVSRFTGNSESNTKSLHTMAIELIGDPLSNTDWTLTDVWTDYQEDMDKAQSRLLAWINNEIVLFFFEKLGIYEDRKIFWKQYAERIPEIYILMKSGEWRYLSRSIPTDLKKRLEPRIRVSRGGQTALIMYTRSHMLIEIANQGNAFYAYEQNGKFYIPPNKLYGIQKANDLKNPGLVPNYTLNESTMRLIHRDGWQFRMKQWLRIHAGL